MRYILCLLCTCQITLLWGQFDSPLTTARQVATGGQDLLLLSPEALYSNPAALFSGDSGISGILNYANRYSTDIRSASGGISWQNDRQAGGILIGNYGIAGFRQNQISLAYARKLSQSTHLGIQANYFNLQVEDFGSRSNLDLNVGLQHEFSDVVSSGLFVINPLSGVTDEQIQGGTGVSALAHISEALCIYTSIFRDWHGNMDLRPGIQYDLLDEVELIWSFSTKGVAMNFGTDIAITPYWSVFLGYSTHQFLGNSLSFSTYYAFQ